MHFVEAMTEERAAAFLRGLGYVVLKKERIAVLNSCTEIDEHSLQAMDKTNDFLKYLKSNTAYCLAHEIIKSYAELVYSVEYPKDPYDYLQRRRYRTEIAVIKPRREGVVYG